MFILFPFHPGDQRQAEAWMQWVLEIGAGRNHHIILMPAKELRDFEAVRQLAIQAFQNVDVLPDAEGIIGHPEGPNSMMRQAVWHMQTSNLGPWMFCEPDNIPRTADAFDLWEREYRAYGKPFMGELRPAHDVTPDYLTGNMMLPKDALLMAPMLGRRGLSKDGVELAFDIVAASQTLPQAHLTKLLQQVPKPRDGEGHSFPDQESLSILRPGAAFFHPCKDLSLIDRLRERKNGAPRVVSVSVTNGGAGTSSIPGAPETAAAAPNPDLAALLAKVAELEAKLQQRNGGYVPCDRTQKHPAVSASAETHDVPKAERNAAPTFKPKARRKKARRTLSPEHKQKLRDAWKARRAVAS